MENIEGTAAWFAKKFPGFLNWKCYLVLEKRYQELNPHLYEEYMEKQEIREEDTVSDITTDFERKRKRSVEELCPSP